jgi:hypothetical protein
VCRAVVGLVGHEAAAVEKYGVVGVADDLVHAGVLDLEGIGAQAVVARVEEEARRRRDTVHLNGHIVHALYFERTAALGIDALIG